MFGSKNLVAVTAHGRDRAAFFDQARFQALSKELDGQVKAHVGDSKWTASFRPEAGTTWWLDRAFNGGYLGKQGGYLPWHNFDEDSFDPADFAKVGTKAFLEISGPPKVCNQCRHIMCTRAGQVDRPPYAGRGVRPEFETIALWINCCIVDRDAIFHINHLCNELGVDTMTLGSVMAGAMELAEKGCLAGFKDAPAFGSAPDMIRTLKDIAYRSSPLGELLGGYSDRVSAGVAAGRPAADLEGIARCVTTAFGGLGYAGVEPKVFPGMFAAYATSNRGRGDHTYAWTIQAEEGGLQGAEELAAYVAAGQEGKAIVDSLGLCDFFTEDTASDLFLGLYRALTGIEYTADAFKACGIFRNLLFLQPEIINDGNASGAEQGLSDEVGEEEYGSPTGPEEIQGKRQPQTQAPQPGIGQAGEGPAAEIENGAKSGGQIGQIFLLGTPPRFQEKSIGQDLDRIMIGMRAIGFQ